MPFAKIEISKILLGCMQENAFYDGNDIGLPFRKDTSGQCRQECQREPGCEFWSFEFGKCFLKSDRTEVILRQASKSGTKDCPGKIN